MGIRILKDLQEKEQTRALYEQNFEDPKIFIDYYYHEKCKDNLILVKEEEGQILSMLHLNPYLVSVCGNRVKSFYIFAVATDKNHRHEGHMTELLRAAFSYMKDQKIPFCFLLPVDAAIYEWIGFFVLCDLVRERDDSGLPTGR
ncbi:MAG: GNAT family N-acetyltransferase, partial [Lachnospiraceae bacterium]|nr:GNAT family N-acetyltransferase [Lachnospiraceae bacterium]